MKLIPIVIVSALAASTTAAFAQAPTLATPPEAVMAFGAGPGSSIGVRTRDVSPADAARLRTESGAIIDQVYDNTPARTAGLQTSDVIVEFDGERVRGTRHLARLVQETPPGRTVRVVVLREGRNTTLTITPERDRAMAAERWEPAMRVGPGVRVDAPRFRAQIGPFEWDGFRSRARLGATVQEITPQLAEFFGARQGVLVSSVLDNSPASRAGLRTGDVITAVNGQRVDARGDLLDVLANAQDGAELELTIVRDRRESSIRAKVERPDTNRGALD
jgi:serine protease Do